MLWFRNVQFFRLASDHELDIHKIEDALAKKPFMPCDSHALFSQGWIAPARHMPDLFAPNMQNAALIALKTDEKILPAAVVRQQAEERILRIEAEEGRKVGRREAKEIREQITDELTPKAFIKSNVQRAIIDLEHGWVWVEGSSASKAENLLSLLREAVGALPVRRIDTQTSPQSAMTEWLESGAPTYFELDSDCELRFPGDGGAIARFAHQALDAEEVRFNLANGKMVTRLGLIWKERMAFQLTEQLEIKRLTMLDVLEDELENTDVSDQAALFDASFALLTGELRHFLPMLLAALGGENTQ